jgi:mycobactin salicyl-AMP ligase
MSTAFEREQHDLGRGFTPFPANRAEVYREVGYWAVPPSNGPTRPV